MFLKIHDFLTQGIWRIRSRDLPNIKSFFIRGLRIIILSIRGFHEDQCYLRASALTFYTLLSLVPVLAVAIGVAQGFGFLDQLRDELYGRLQNFIIDKEVLDQIFNFSQNMLETTKGGLVGGIGVLLLFWTVIKVLGNIESAFNDIWGIKGTRPFHRKCSDYLFIMLVCPLLFIFSSSLTILITSKIEALVLQLSVHGPIAELIFAGLIIFRYFATWTLFGFIYIVMPNTKVSFDGAFLGSLVTGSLFLIVQKGFVTLQFGVAKYNAIYGTLASLPLLLVWFQISWLIVLFGAEIAFAYQNEDTYEFEPDCLKVNLGFKRLLTLHLLQWLVKDFSDGRKPRTATNLAHLLDIPIRLVRQILFELVHARLVSEVNTGDERNSAYQPARDINRYSITAVLDSLDSAGTDNLPIHQSVELKKLQDSLQNLKHALHDSPHNLLLKDI